MTIDILPRLKTRVFSFDSIIKHSTSAKIPRHKLTVSRGDPLVTAHNHIPHDTFAEAVASLDRESLAALVSETYAVTADEVSVDGPRLTVVEHDRRTELLVVSGPDDLDSSEGYDTVITARDSLLADRPLPADTAVMTPADLRQRLLYAIGPDDADAITTEFLDAPMRSPAYGTSSAADTTTDHEASSDDDDTPVVTEAGPQNTPGSIPGDPLGESPPVSTASTAQSADASPDDSPSQPSRSQSSDAPSSEVLPDGNRRWILVGMIGLGVLLGLAAVGAGIVGDAFITGGDGVASVDDGTPTDPDPSESGPPDSNTNNDGGDTAALDGPADRNLTTVTARTTSVAPTCERSAIHVVQLQMNAFRYNNNTTNTGILTARQFASPSNRAAVGSPDQFISLFDMPQYAPLLTYDSVQYSVPSADGDITTIDVVTRENGTVTGRYDFRLKKVPSEETGVNTTRADTACWMTSGVRASPL